MNFSHFSRTWMLYSDLKGDFWEQLKKWKLKKSYFWRKWWKGKKWIIFMLSALVTITSHTNLMFIQFHARFRFISSSSHFFPHSFVSIYFCCLPFRYYLREGRFHPPPTVSPFTFDCTEDKQKCKSEKIFQRIDDQVNLKSNLREKIGRRHREFGKTMSYFRRVCC